MDAGLQACDHPAMTLTFDERWIEGWRGPLIAAFIALLAGLPTLMTLGPLDRDESRFAQATAQMLETDDYVDIRFQEEPRHKKPVGIHWLQAAAVSLVSDVEARDIRPYRIPSLLGAMLAAAACAWGAGLAFGARTGVLAGALLGVSFLLSSEAGIAKTDAMLCASVTMAMVVLSRFYIAHREGQPTPARPYKLALWGAIALGVLIKGPIILLVVGLTLVALGLWDKQWRWIKDIGWGWGLVLVALTIGPWAMAVTVRTDGAFWGTALGGDLFPKLVGGHERHGGWPGYYLLLSPLLMFPGTLLIPAALILGWRMRAEPAVRFALCWLIPTWIAFELFPTKLWHYTLPTFGALAWLMAASVREPLTVWGRRYGAILMLFGAVLVTALCLYGFSEFGGQADQIWATLTIVLALVGSVVAGFFLLNRAAMTATLTALGFGILAHMTLVQLLGGLGPLWTAPRLAEAIREAGLHPMGGQAPGAVTLAGYSEPSAIFLLGTDTRLGDGADAARAVAGGRVAVVDQSQQEAFNAEAEALAMRPRPVAVVEGLNYSNGDPLRLSIYGPFTEAEAR